MSTEPETPPIDDPTGPVTPPTPPPDEPVPPVSFEPARFYSVVVTCATEGCINYGRIWTVDQPVYSNAGNPYIQDGICGQMVRILSAELLVPQPVLT